MSRTADIHRKTRETDVSVMIELDGSGKADLETGIGFFDHMLESLTKHSGIDLTVRTKGDLHVDMHHTVEDTGIVIGQAIKQALGDFAGITRFGNAYIPMDETLSRASIDLCKRPYLVWKVEFTQERLGDMDTEMFKHWFQSFALKAGLSMNVTCLDGENNHHMAEASFKALARALRQAVEIDPRKSDAIPSTKGSL